MVVVALTIMSCSKYAWEKTGDGALICLEDASGTGAKRIRLYVIDENIIRVSATPDRFSAGKSLAVQPKPVTAAWSVAEEGRWLVLQTSSLKAHANLQTGEIKFTDLDNRLILREKKGGGKWFAPVEADGAAGYTLRQVFESPADEAFYGLGQHQADEFNYKGKNETLFQHNAKGSIPFLASNKNYGLLWDNYSLCKFGDARDYAQLSQFKLYGLDGAEGGLTAMYYTGSNPDSLYAERMENTIDYENPETVKNFPAGFAFRRARVVWEGDLQAKESGLHRFLLYYAGYAKLWIDGRLAADRWRTAWNPGVAKLNVYMEAGKHHAVRLEWKPDGDVSYIGLKALSPVDPEEQNRLSLYARMGDQIEYYFIRGASADEVIKGYRSLSGKAQVAPKWAMGLGQSGDGSCREEAPWGVRRFDANKRVLQLARSGFCGLPTYGAGACWEDLKAQLSAGLNHSLSGHPYWTMDTGGFWALKRLEQAAEGSEDMNEWRELNVRWTQLGAFAPLFCSHGPYPFCQARRLAPGWRPACQSMAYYNKLRCRLTPYIYSLAGWVYWRDYTIMRPMIMDFGYDARVTNLATQFMFGPSLLVCPVYAYKVREREVYFPEQTGWYDFYTGAYTEGGQSRLADAPYQRMPLFVKAGSIIPLGEEIQDACEKPDAPLTLYVYAGTDASFTLYEDEGVNYNYKKGMYSTISIRYNDRMKEVTLDERQGSFKGMTERRTFYVVLIDKDKAKGFDSRPVPDAAVTYDGARQTIRF
jgi:alpha-glucosidase (family GH31 glycosyl hydrolase)